jgi:hypothetical protein
LYGSLTLRVEQRLKEFENKALRIGNAAHMGEMISAYKVLIGKPEWKRPFQRLRHGQEDNIGIYLREIV